MSIHPEADYDTRKELKRQLDCFKEYIQKSNAGSNYVQIYLLPFYNDWDYLQEFFKCYEHARSSLLIIDDGSLKKLEYVDIPEKIRHAVLVVRNNRNLGIQDSLNKGIQTIKSMKIPMDIIIHRIDTDERYVWPRSCSNIKKVCAIHHSYLSIKPILLYIPPLILRGYFSWTLLFENLFIHSCASLVINYPQNVEAIYGKISTTNYIEANGAEDYLLWNNQVYEYGVRSWRSSYRITTRGSNRLKNNIVTKIKSAKYLKKKIICFGYIYSLYTGIELQLNQLESMCKPILSYTSNFDSATLKLLKARYRQHHKLRIIESVLITMDTKLRISMLTSSKQKVIFSLVHNPLLIIPLLLSRQLLRSFLNLLIT